MEKINIKRLFSGFKLKKQSDFKTIGAKANHDWRLMLIVFFFAWVMIVGGSTYLFLQINRGDIFQISTDESERKTSVDEKLLLKTVEYFEARKLKLEGIKSNPSIFQDPSL